MMCSEEANSNVRTWPRPDGQVAEFLMTAERELSAFYTSVFEKYGAEEAMKAAGDWVEEVETMEWPNAGAPPNWRHTTIAASARRALRVSSPSNP